MFVNTEEKQLIAEAVSFSKRRQLLFFCSFSFQKRHIEYSLIELYMQLWYAIHVQKMERKSDAAPN